MSFDLFDPKAEVDIREGHFPHWYQAGVTYFVTFRTEDSVPQKLVRDWHGRRDIWLIHHGIDPSSPQWKSRLEDSPDLKREFDAKFIREFMEYLDRGYCECALRDPALAAVIEESLQHFDGERYHLGDFIVMPNHVHVLVCLLGSTEIEPQCRSWKKFTAGRINRALARHGRFWQSESFDHLVRSPNQFEYLQRYIAENPQKAGLRAGEYLHCPLK